MTEIPSCNILWNVGIKTCLMSVRQLSQSLLRWRWVFWNWLRDFEWQKLASGCMQTVSVTNSEQQQQLDRELWGCLLSCCENILEGKETFLVNGYLTICSETQILSHEWSVLLHDALCICYRSLLVSIKILGKLFCWFKFGPTHPVKLKTVMVFYYVPGLGSSVSPRQLFFWISEKFLTVSLERVCSAPWIILHSHTFAISLFT